MNNIETLADFIRLHHSMKNKDHLRMGQRFVNMYIKEPWPDLFYETNEHKAIDKISLWLLEHHYIHEDQSMNTLPPIACQAAVAHLQ